MTSALGFPALKQKSSLQQETLTTHHIQWKKNHRSWILIWCVFGERNRKRIYDRQREDNWWTYFHCTSPGKFSLRARIKHSAPLSLLWKTQNSQCISTPFLKATSSSSLYPPPTPRHPPPHRTPDCPPKPEYEIDHSVSLYRRCL